MSAIKDGRYPLTISGHEYHLLFSLNALDEIQDKFGGYDKLPEVFDQDNKDWLKNTKWLLALLLNEGAADDEPELTERQVGKLIHAGNMREVQEAMLSAFKVGTSGTAEAQDEEETEGDQEENTEQGNVVSVQGV